VIASAFGASGAETAMATTYVYKVRDRAGRLVEGSLEAQNEQLVITKLREMGYVPLNVSAKARSTLSFEINLRKSKVSLKDVAVVSRQLATMLSSGLSILRALMILAEQTESKALAAVIGEMKLDIEQGWSLSQAVAKHRDVFPPIYLAMVRAGETGGVLDDVMLRLADTLEKQLELRGKIKSAMTYPIAVAAIVVLILTAMLLFVVPMFQSMYHDLHGTLPLPTRVLITASDVVTRVWWLLGLAAVGGTLLFRRWVATPEGRLAFDRFKLRLTIFGPLMRKTSLARFARTLASLIRSGVPIMQSFEIVGETAGNAVVAHAVTNARERVRLGESVSESLTGEEVFPPMVVQMIAVGEETGALDRMLEKIADFYDREVEATVNSLTSLIEPLLMVFMGVSVGGMVVALYMPMFQIINLVK
jgi:type IV pilus assembly protein PilC